MIKAFLQLWKSDIAEGMLKTVDYLGHSASDQLYRAQPGDTVWVVTVYKGGDAFLLGKLKVDESTDKEGAKKLLETNDIFDRKYHVLSKPRKAEPLRKISLMDVVEDLRFVSKARRNRLKVTDGRVNAQQLQSMRELTSESARMLEEKWTKAKQIES